MSTAERQAELRITVARERRKKKGPRFADTWWRHAIALLAVLSALFPVAYIASAAFNADNSLSGSSLIPRHVTFDNFKSLFTHQQHVTGHATFQSAHFTNWPVLMAGTVISQVPVLVMFVFAQRFFVRSIAQSGIK